jgi:D-alanyl-D-alanine carboxypeptidase
VVDIGALALAVGLAGSLLCAAPLQAASPKPPAKPAAAKYIPPQYAAIVIDADTGTVLHAVDADAPTYPASLTKMMTLYLTFGALSQHRLQLEHRLPISDYAASMAPSKLGLKPGSSIRVEEAILAIVTKSANDAAVVLAEGLGGSEENFARMMTEQARRLGMSRTRFENASGLPDPDQVTTARDMALLGRALIAEFPAYYPYFSTRSFVFAGHVQANHNHLLETYDGADGIKTGFIRASGFNLVASAKRDGHRLIGVVFGGQSQPWRDHQMARLLDQGFVRAGAGDAAMANVADSTIGDTVSPHAKLDRLALDDNVPAPAAQGDLDDAPRLPMPLAGTAPLTLAPLTVTPLTVTPVAPPPVAHATSRSAAKLASADHTMPSVAAPLTGTWLVQVGAFAAPAQASAAGKAAIKTANLYHGQVMVSALPHGHGMLYRARVVGLAETQARDACKTLSREHMPCVVLAPDGTVAH